MARSTCSRADLTAAGRAPLAALLAFTLALSVLLPGAAAQAGAMDGEPPITIDLRADFGAQPVDAILTERDDDNGGPAYSVWADAAGGKPVTVEWSDNTTEGGYQEVVDIALKALRDRAAHALKCELAADDADDGDELSTDGNSECTLEPDEAVDAAIHKAVEVAIAEDEVASQLGEAIAREIDTALADKGEALTAVDLLQDRALETHFEASTDVSEPPEGEDSSKKLTTSFVDLSIVDSETRRRVQLEFSLELEEPIWVQPEWAFTVKYAPPPDASETSATASLDQEYKQSDKTAVDVELKAKDFLPPLELKTDEANPATSDTFRLWEQAEICEPGEECRAEISGPVGAATEGQGGPQASRGPVEDDGQEVRVVASSQSNDGTLLLGWLGDRETPGGKVNQCNGIDYQGLPGTILFDFAAGTNGFDGEKLVTVQVPRSIVQEDTNNGRAQYDVCFLDEDGLEERDEASDDPGPSTQSGDDNDADATGPFLLPTCGRPTEDGRAEPPCVESRTAIRSVGNLPPDWRSSLRGGLEVVIRLPAEDPMFR